MRPNLPAFIQHAVTALVAQHTASEFERLGHLEQKSFRMAEQLRQLGRAPT